MFIVLIFRCNVIHITLLVISVIFVHLSC